MATPDLPIGQLTLYYSSLREVLGHPLVSIVAPNVMVCRRFDFPNLFPAQRQGGKYEVEEMPISGRRREKGRQSWQSKAHDSVDTTLNRRRSQSPN